MSESGRRIHQASRQATLAKATLKGLGYTEDDIAWTEVRTIALMLEGVTFVEAVDQASRECVQRLFDRKLAALAALENMRQRERAEVRAKMDAEHALHRNTLTARGELGGRQAVPQTDPIEDCGSGVRIERRYLDGILDGIAWWHPCNGTERPDFMSVRPAWKDGWDVVQVQPLTLSPSILCRVCQFHGHIREGRWFPA